MFEIKRLEKENILENWLGLIPGAEGKGEEFLRTAVQKIEALKMPNVVIAKENIPLKDTQMLTYKKRSFLVVANSRLKDYEALISAQDYGVQLSVAWYLTIKPSSAMRAMRKFQKSSEAEQAFTSSSVLTKKLMGGIMDKINNTVSAERMDIFDEEELADFATSVHHALMDSLKELMSGLDQDFSKVNTKTRGFLNIS